MLVIVIVIAQSVCVCASGCWKVCVYWPVRPINSKDVNDLFALEILFRLALFNANFECTLPMNVFFCYSVYVWFMAFCSLLLLLGSNQFTHMWIHAFHFLLLFFSTSFFNYIFTAIFCCCYLAQGNWKLSF